LWRGASAKALSPWGRCFAASIVVVPLPFVAKMGGPSPAPMGQSLRAQGRPCARSVALTLFRELLGGRSPILSFRVADQDIDKGSKKLLGGVGILSVGTLISLLSATSYALALEPKTGEAKILEDCDRRLCTMMLRKELAGDDLKCELTKTWA